MYHFYDIIETMEEIYKNFETKRAEALKQLETKEGELGPEKEKEILKEVVVERISTAQPLPTTQQQAIVQKAPAIKRRAERKTN